MNLKKLVHALVAQFPITLDVNHNLNVILSIVEQAQEDTLIVLPEGALSGYDEDARFVQNIDLPLLNDSNQRLRRVVERQNVHLVFGSCLYEDGKWFNAGIYYSPRKEFIYRKVNLATNERRCFTAGDSLSSVETRINGQPIKLGIQLCREIRFPEQWQFLARQGAEVFVYLTNAVGDSTHAVGDSTHAQVWRSHLISRAAENQRFVLCANNAHPTQKCPSMIIAPSGEVAWEKLSAGVEVGRYTLDLSQVSNWYLDQSRRELLNITDNPNA
jgi:predicted amidohydrolase